MHKELGKITSVRFGMGGYQDAQFGIWFTFGNDGWGVGSGEGVWSSKPSKCAKWTEADRLKLISEIALKINDWLIEAKVDSVEKLKGIPVEITFDSPHGKMLSWRILTEVL